MATGPELQAANNLGQEHRSTETGPSFAGFLGSLMSLGCLGGESDYNPPSDPELKEAYDAGYRNATSPQS